MKVKGIYFVDVALLLVAVTTCLTGVLLHKAGHFNTHDVWHNWAIAHSVSSVLMLVFGALHLYAHLGWYKSLLKGKTKGKSVITLMLSVLFVVVTMTGVVMLAMTFVPNTGVGLWHYVVGIALSVASIAHIVLRWQQLLKLKSAIR